MRPMYTQKRPMCNLTEWVLSFRESCREPLGVAVCCSVLQCVAGERDACTCTQKRPTYRQKRFENSKETCQYTKQTHI